MTDYYRKKPVVVQARQWFANGHCPIWAQHAVAEFNTFFEVGTLEGVMKGSPGDWIILGVAGEVYPCKPEIFAATYEKGGGE